jgi:enolase-phosphatase E1
MTSALSTLGVRGILLDIEGTTTPISFVHDVLFSYARTQAKDFLVAHGNSDQVRDDISKLRDEHAFDVAHGLNPPTLASPKSKTEIESITTYVHWLIERDRKSTGLKSLQGKIWRQGYLEGTLKSQVFADVAAALERWSSVGISISIFSSGSILAQKLLFAHTQAGDLTRFINNYFDTTVGIKTAVGSYQHIAATLRLQANEILFISDVVSELAAASEAGMQTLLSVRPGNQSQDLGGKYQTIYSFDEL